MEKLKGHLNTLLQFSSIQLLSPVRLFATPWTAALQASLSITRKYFFSDNVIDEQFSSIQLLSHVRLFATPWTAALQVSLSNANSWRLLKLMSIESVMPLNHLILCHPLLLLPSTFPSIRVFSNELALTLARWKRKNKVSGFLQRPERIEHW